MFASLSSVKTCDLVLFNFRFHARVRLSSSWIAYFISALELVKISMSSAKARRSPLLTISRNLDVVPSASSRYISVSYITFTLEVT